ncbi:MAG: omptin family outer membrane protease [Desulfocapsa sp.]|nr:omptin family outer membrane protease [Desulfocapsa sp.]
MKQVRKATALSLAFGLLYSGTALAATTEEISIDTAAQNTIESPAKSSAFDISIGSEFMSGDTTYSIGGAINFSDGSTGNVHFPISELEWPLDVLLARFNAELIINPKWRINGTIKTNITEPDSHMIDRDWLTTSNPAQLDVYSESNISTFNAFIFDVDLEWIFMQRPSSQVYAGVGYHYQNFEFEGQAIHQYSPSGYPGVEYWGDGSVDITYEIAYKMPYLLIGAEHRFSPNFIMSGSLAFSPYVDAQDEDHHLARVPMKVSEGDMDGTAIMLDISGLYDFASSWFLEGGIHFTQIDVDGKQTQFTYGTPYGVIDIESTSSQISTYLNIGFRF